MGALEGTLIIGCFVLAWWLVCVIGHGYANTVDWIGLKLHRHAENCRRSHAARTKVIAKRWSERPTVKTEEQVRVRGRRAVETA